MLEGLREPSSAVAATSSGFMFMFFAGTVFGALGGVLAAMFFRKDVPPALGGRRAAAPPPPCAYPRTFDRWQNSHLAAAPVDVVAFDAHVRAKDRRQISPTCCRRTARSPRRRRFASRPTSRAEDVYARAERDPEGFWAGFAAELEWFTPWTQVLDWQPPHAKWFVGGTLNASVNCVDRHVRGPRRNKAALIWEGEPGDRRTLTYFDLYRQVSQFANVLKSLGVTRGDRVAIYLPLVPELAIAMLACARIGAVHSVVFGGFSSESLRDRINDAQATLLVTADGGWRRGQVVPLKQMADVALEGTPSIENVVIVQRHGTARRRRCT